jgi:hypothetical protein
LAVHRIATTAESGTAASTDTHVKTTIVNRMRGIFSVEDDPYTRWIAAWRWLIGESAPYGALWIRNGTHLTEGLVRGRLAWTL